MMKIKSYENCLHSCGLYVKTKILIIENLGNADENKANYSTL